MNLTMDENIRVHFNVIRLVGVLLMLYGTTVTIIMCVRRDHVTLDCKSETDLEPIIDQTLCQDLKTFPLGQRVFATVCRYQKRVRVDLRRFMNGTATIPLSNRQWKRLKSSGQRIDLAIKQMT